MYSIYNANVFIFGNQLGLKNSKGKLVVVRDSFVRTAVEGYRSYFIEKEKCLVYDEVKLSKYPRIVTMKKRNESFMYWFNYQASDPYRIGEEKVIDVLDNLGNVVTCTIDTKHLTLKRIKLTDCNL